MSVPKLIDDFYDFLHASLLPDRGMTEFFLQYMCFHFMEGNALLERELCFDIYFPHGQTASIIGEKNRRLQRRTQKRKEKGKQGSENLKKWISWKRGYFKRGGGRESRSLQRAGPDLAGEPRRPELG